MKYGIQAVLVMMAVVLFGFAMPEAIAQGAPKMGDLMKNTVQSNVQPAYQAVMYIFIAIGGICIGVAFVYMLIRNERNADKYSWGKIGTLFVIGGALLAVSFFINVARTTASDGGAQDQLPNFGQMQ